MLRTDQIDSKGLSSYERYNRGSKMRQSVENTPQKDYPQRIEYSNKIYYRIKLNEEKR